MPLKTYDTKDAVPAEQRDAAVETKDGKWIAEEIDPNAVSPAAQSALDKLRQEKKAEKERADAAQRERDELKRAADAAAKGITAEELKKIQDAEAAARKPIEDELARVKAENLRIKYNDRLKAQALAAGVMPDRIEDAMLVLERRTKPTDDGTGIAVLDKEGNVTGTKLDDFLGKTFKEEKPYYYQGSTGSGSGAAGSAGAGTGSAYDPVAEGKRMAEAQKKGSEQAAAALR